MTYLRDAAIKPVLDARVAAFLVFAVGFAIVILAGLLADNADYARAQYSIWPSAALGGWAVALMLRRGLGGRLAERRWRVWWAWGLLAYALHLYWGFGLVYGGDVDAVYAGQGSVVASANFALVILWAASVVGAFTGWPVRWLHLVTAALFAVSILMASILFGRGFSPIGGVVLAVVWLSAFYLRQPEPKG